jgi:hypothetical protein
MHVAGTAGTNNAANNFGARLAFGLRTIVSVNAQCSICCEFLNVVVHLSFQRIGEFGGVAVN